MLRLLFVFLLLAFSIEAMFQPEVAVISGKIHIIDPVTSSAHETVEKIYRQKIQEDALGERLKSFGYYIWSDLPRTRKFMKFIELLIPSFNAQLNYSSESIETSSSPFYDSSKEKILQNPAILHDIFSNFQIPQDILDPYYCMNYCSNDECVLIQQQCMNYLKYNRDSLKILFDELLYSFDNPLFSQNYFLLILEFLHFLKQISCTFEKSDLGGLYKLYTELSQLSKMALDLPLTKVAPITRFLVERKFKASSSYKYLTARNLRDFLAEMRVLGLC